MALIDNNFACSNCESFSTRLGDVKIFDTKYETTNREIVIDKSGEQSITVNRDSSDAERGLCRRVELHFLCEDCQQTSILKIVSYLMLTTVEQLLLKT